MPLNIKSPVTILPPDGQINANGGRSKRQPLACSGCKKGKNKCDHVQPKCGLCARRQIECVYPSPPPPRFKTDDREPTHTARLLAGVPPEQMFSWMANLDVCTGSSSVSASAHYPETGGDPTKSIMWDTAGMPSQASGFFGTHLGQPRRQLQESEVSSFSNIGDLPQPDNMLYVPTHDGSTWTNENEDDARLWQSLAEFTRHGSNDVAQAPPSPGDNDRATESRLL
ncbi:hypothetical protein QFC24_005177 [Naganishia onofrii]|uniref:Uncharacterized protein n=1 Tax=Naganishia onofrii TaxID=1851511 RepID=A0ACC2X8Y8_9TREE|nr:hypothetical protein QFC24_005177 [Naganishia onofrii]